MIFERNELILEQEKILEQRNHGPSLQSPNENDINISQHSLNSWPVGGNTADPRKECKQYSD
jgi:hypothetical protein